MTLDRLSTLGLLCLAASVPLAPARAQSISAAQAALDALPANALPNLAVRGPGDRSGQGQAVLPPSSIVQPGSLGRKLHTNVIAFAPSGRTATAAVQPAATVAGAPPYSGYYFNTPASLACVYGLAAATAGCNPETLTAANNGPATNGSHTIALVEFYDSPNALADLNAYSAQFGLPAVTAATFKTVYASGTNPGRASVASGEGYALQTAVDVQTAHALAPAAKIILVEASAFTLNAYIQAIDVASAQVAAAGGGEVVMGTSATEDPSFASYESHFTGSPGVVYFAATSGFDDTAWPSVSPNVVAVGGTSLSRRNDARVANQYGLYRTETAWNLTGGGVSQVFETPSYQAVISSRLQNNKRGVPDISFLANPYTPVWAYCSDTTCRSSTVTPTGGSWFAVGGTDVAAAGVAAMANSAGSFFPNSAAQLSYIYGKLGTSSFFDVSYGACGTLYGYGGTAGAGPGDAAGWDFCTGVGSPRGLTGLGAGAASQVVRR